MFGIYINLVFRFDFRTQKLLYEKTLGHFDDFIDLGRTVRVCKIRSFFKNNYFKMFGIYIKLDCRFEFRTQKLPYEKISGHFDDFIDLGHAK